MAALHMTQVQADAVRANVAALQYARQHPNASQYKLKKVLIENASPQLAQAFKDRVQIIACTSDYDVPHFKMAASL